MSVVGFLIGCFVCYFWMDNNFRIKNVVMKCVLSFMAVMATFSFLSCLFLFAGINRLVFEILALVVPMPFIIKIRKNLYVKPMAVLTTVKFPLLLLTLSFLSFFSYRFFTTVKRWGDWDAWGIWSLHARFLSSGDNFSNLFSDSISWTHPDYPLLLPSTIAMVWNSLGGNSPFVPSILAFLISICLILLILSSFLEKGHRFFGLLLFGLITYSMVLFPFVTSQYADTLLALFFLIPFVLLKHLDQDSGKDLFFIGFFVASAGWIKNEGLLFLVIFTGCFILKNFRKRNRLKYYAAGTLLPLLILVVFKFNFATASDLVNENTNEHLGKISDMSRYKAILDFAYAYFRDNSEMLWMSLLAILILNYKYFYSFCFTVILLLLCAYFMVYVITPNDLQWHLSTSFDRLIHQVFPVLMYSVFMSGAEKISASTNAESNTISRSFIRNAAEKFKFSRFGKINQ